MCFVDGSSYQSAVGAGGEAAHLGEDGDIAHAGGDQNFFKLLANALADGHDVVFSLLGAVRDADTAGQVDVGDMYAGGLLDADSQLEEDTCQLRIIGVRDGVGGEEGVDAKVLAPFAASFL